MPDASRPSGGSRSRFATVVEARLARRTPLAAGVVGTIVLASPEEEWTIDLRSSSATLKRGRARNPTTTVEADAETLHALMAGAVPGLQAFFEGRLAVRGNVGLALKLDLMFPSETRPAIRPGVVVAAGVETFFLEVGPAQAPPLILLHGLGATNVSMNPLMVELSRDHRVIAPDLPGFGESAKPIRTYSFDFFAEWMLALIDALGLGRPSLIGNSMGGRISLEVGLRAPGRIDRLVLLSPSLAWRSFRHFVPIVRVLRPELSAVPLYLPRAQLMWGLRRIFANPDRMPQTWLDAALDEFLHVFASARGRIAFFSAARQIYLEEEVFWEHLRTLRAPSLFFWGRQDRLVPWRFARHVAAALPQARSVIVPDCGHVPQIEAVDKIATPIREFLR